MFGGKMSNQRKLCSLAAGVAEASSQASFGVLLGTALAVVVLGVPLGPARSEVFYQTGFEPPAFAPGPIDGQAGWAIAAADTGGPFGSIPVGSISTTFPNGGEQSPRIDPMANNAGNGAYASFRYLPAGASPVFNGEGRQISVKVEAALLGPTTGAADQISVNFQPMLYFDDPAIYVGDVYRSVMWLSSDGHIHVVSGTTQHIGPAYLLGQYNELEARFDFPDQKTIYFLNGTEFDQDSWADLGVTITEFSTPELQLGELHASGNYNPLNYQGYFDDLEVSAVPEPSSLALLASGFLSVIGYGLWRRPDRPMLRGRLAGCRTILEGVFSGGRVERGCSSIS
jgi:PEP-CTERM motif